MFLPIAPQEQGLFGAALASPPAVTPSAGPNTPTWRSRPRRGICDFQTVCREETVSANSLPSLRVTQPGRPGCDSWPPRPLLQLARVLPPQRGWVLPPRRGRVLALEQQFPKQSPSSKQRQCCFAVRETPAGSEADGAGPRNNLNTMQRKMSYRLSATFCWHCGEGLGTGRRRHCREVCRLSQASSTDPPPRGVSPGLSSAPPYGIATLGRCCKTVDGSRGVISAGN